MTISGRLKNMVARQIRTFGENLQITLRERSTLYTRSSGNPTNSLTLDGAASIGATAITAEALTLGGGLPAGAQVTISGTVYTLAAAAEASPGLATIALTLTSGLVGNLTDGTAISVSQPYADTTYYAMRSRVDEKDVDGGVPDTARVYRLSARNQTRKPKKGDVLVDASGSTTETVTEVAKAEPGATSIYWSVTVGSAG